MFIASKFCKISFTLDKLIERANVDDSLKTFIVEAASVVGGSSREKLAYKLVSFGKDGTTIFHGLCTCGMARSITHFTSPTWTNLNLVNWLQTFL
jgi:hypothetical protein